MTRYFFELADGHRIIPDPEGESFADPGMARAEALRVLGDMARYEMPDGDHRVFSVKVTDDTGRPVVTASLSLMVTYPGKSKASPADA